MSDIGRPPRPRPPEPYRLEGRLLKIARHSVGLTLRQLSERTGLTPAQISAMERGRTRVTATVVDAVTPEPRYVSDARARQETEEMRR